MEYLDIVDENGTPTGEIVSSDAAHRDGIRHRTAHVWVVRRSAEGYEILLQKRSEEKESFPVIAKTGRQNRPDRIRNVFFMFFSEISKCWHNIHTIAPGLFQITY